MKTSQHRSSRRNAAPNEYVLGVPLVAALSWLYGWWARGSYYCPSDCFICFCIWTRADLRQFLEGGLVAVLLAALILFLIRAFYRSDQRYQVRFFVLCFLVGFIATVMSPSGKDRYKTPDWVFELTKRQEEQWSADVKSSPLSYVYSVIPRHLLTIQDIELQPTRAADKAAYGFRFSNKEGWLIFGTVLYTLDNEQTCEFRLSYYLDSTSRKIVDFKEYNIDYFDFDGNARCY